MKNNQFTSFGRVFHLIHIILFPSNKSIFTTVVKTVFRDVDVVCDIVGHCGGDIVMVMMVLLWWW